MFATISIPFMTGRVPDGKSALSDREEPRIISGPQAIVNDSAGDFRQRRLCGSKRLILVVFRATLDNIRQPDQPVYVTTSIAG